MIPSNASLIAQLIADGLIRSPQVEAAFRALPRANFAPPDTPIEWIYRDDVIPIKQEGEIWVSTITNPGGIANMLERLQIEPGMRILEIGAASGYTAALLAHLVGENGHVTSVEIDPDLAQMARRNLDAHGLQRVEVAHFDGSLGYPKNAPYDRILLTVGAWDIPTAWREQLTPNGLLLVSLWVRSVQRSFLFRRTATGLVAQGAQAMSFVRMRGQAAGGEGKTRFGPEHLFYAETDSRNTTHGESLYSLLQQTPQQHRIGIRLCAAEVLNGLVFYLAAHLPNFGSIGARRELMQQNLIAGMPGLSHRHSETAGLLTPNALCLLHCPPEQNPLTTRTDLPDLYRNLVDFDLHLRTHGAQPQTLTTALRQAIEQWQAAARPTDASLRAEVTFGDDAPPTSPRAVTLHKPSSRLTLQWES
ncbi:MAG: hypothetical protein OHK0052_15130 [Anaerolineales bacterium]